MKGAEAKPVKVRTVSPRAGDDGIYQLKVTLKNTKPPIWRRIQVPGGITLYKLHRIIQVAMGWEDYHLHVFEIGGTSFGELDPDFDSIDKSERSAKLNRVVTGAGAKFIYEYDFGDSWRHEILVEKVLLPEAGVRYPVCVGGKRACPPEDCGGPWGYENLLEIIKDPEHEQHEEMMTWLGGEFDPEALDLDAVNRELRRIR